MTNLFVVPIKHFLHARHRNCTSETRNRTPENELLYSSPRKKKLRRFSHRERVSRTTATPPWNETTSLRRTSSCFTWRAARREWEREKLERTVWRLQRKCVCVFWEKRRRRDVRERERVRWGASWHVWACVSKVVALRESIKCRILIGCYFFVLVWGGAQWAQWKAYVVANRTLLADNSMVSAHGW